MKKPNFGQKVELRENKLGFVAIEYEKKAQTDSECRKKNVVKL